MRRDVASKIMYCGWSLALLVLSSLPQRGHCIDYKNNQPLSPPLLWLREASIPHDQQKLKLKRDTYTSPGLTLKRLPLMMESQGPNKKSLIYQAADLAKNRVDGTQSLHVVFPESEGTIDLTVAQRELVLKKLLEEGLVGYGRVMNSYTQGATHSYISGLFPGAYQHEDEIAVYMKSYLSDVQKVANTFRRPEAIIGNFEDLIILTQSLRTLLSIYATIHLEPTSDELERTLVRLIFESIDIVLGQIHELDSVKWSRIPSRTNLSNEQVRVYKNNLAKVVARALQVNLSGTETEMVQSILRNYVEDYPDAKSESWLSLLNPLNWPAILIESHFQLNHRLYTGKLRHAFHLQCEFALQSHSDRSSEFGDRTKPL